MLVQAAWTDHYRPHLSVEIRRRQQGQPPAVIAHAWKAQQRLHQRYQHLAYRKQPQIAVVAVARELVGFLWAVMRDLPTPEVAAALRSAELLRSCAPGARRASTPDGVMRLVSA